MQKQLKIFTESKQFQIFFIGIILLSGLVVGLDSYPKISRIRNDITFPRQDYFGALCF